MLGVITIRGVWECGRIGVGRSAGSIVSVRLPISKAMQQSDWKGTQSVPFAGPSASQGVLQRKAGHS
jgi:hypothetical protein